MTRLAILEKQHGKQIRRAENAFRIDLLTNPVWKMGFFASLACAAVAGILMALNINMFLDAFASGQLKSLIMIVLIAYGSILLITIIIAAIRSYGAYRKSLYYQRQYHSLLEKIRRFDQERGGGSRYAQGSGGSSSRYAGGTPAALRMMMTTGRTMTSRGMFRRGKEREKTLTTGAWRRWSLRMMNTVIT